MVVDDVEDDADAEPVRRIDEAAQIVRAAVEAGRREQVDAVVAPAESPGNSLTGIISISVMPTSFSQRQPLGRRRARCRRG